MCHGVGVLKKKSTATKLHPTAGSTPAGFAQHSPRVQNRCTCRKRADGALRFPFSRFFAPNPAGPAPRNRRKGLQRLPSPAPLRRARLRPARTFSTAPLATAHKEPSLRGSPLPRSLLPSPVPSPAPRPSRNSALAPSLLERGPPSQSDALGEPASPPSRPF